ncbi:uncharacterized protein LOC126555319 isoform X1 [Aphis gossypii]|uniref:uncharacterized protein LOC126555319 isoform X1 n=2 Tax=Aphis gossypii TaxID=80765 RepID=UPI002158CD91|nr:uncharacterized protein LOC126555319 isoform X1 [Aphis gossypii]
MDLSSCFDRFIWSCIEEVKTNSQMVSNLSTSNIGEIRPARNQSCLPPPPDYYGPQPLDISIPKLLKLDNCFNANNNSNLSHQIVQTPNNSASSSDLKYVNKMPYKKFLCNWSVKVMEIKLKNDNTKFIVELRGTWISKDRHRTINENHFAGFLDFVVSKNLIKTSHGLYELTGPIANASSDNLYRACLEINGLPRTWKYILTQFPSKFNNFNKKLGIRRKYVTNCLVQEMMTKSYKFVEKLLQVTNPMVDSLEVVDFGITKLQKKIPALDKRLNDC